MAPKKHHIRASAPEPPIGFADYCRIFSVISCVIEEHTDLHHSCILYAMIGSHILREHYRLEAMPASGAAIYCVGSELNPLAFARAVDEQIVPNLDGFHSWIECKEYVIDFMAPLFPENVAELDSLAVVPRRAFMKPRSSVSQTVPMKGDPDGTFLLIQDAACEANMVQSFYRTPLASDLQGISSRWYRRPPKKMNSEIAIHDGKGNVTHLRRKDIGIKGFW